MTVYCDCENCEYWEDGFCYSDRIYLNGNGVCISCIYIEKQDNKE